MAHIVFFCIFALEFRKAAGSMLHAFVALQAWSRNLLMDLGIPNRAMKKVLSVIVMSLYCWGAFGMNLQLDFCCGKQEAAHLTWGGMNFSINHASHHTMTDGCCTRAVQFIKIQQKHQPGTFAYKPFLPSTPLRLSMWLGMPLEHVHRASYSTVQHAPPGSIGWPDTYLYISCFRI